MSRSCRMLVACLLAFSLLAPTAALAQDPAPDPGGGEEEDDLDAVDPQPASTTRPFDGDPSTIQRIGVGPSRFDVAVDISRARFEDGAAGHLVLSTAIDFADALTSGSLLGEGPLLLAPPPGWGGSSVEAVYEEIRRVLPAGRIVYIVGGPAAVDEEVETRVRGMGYDVRRLAGRSRVETAIAVADEVVRLHGTPRFALLARAYAAENDPSSAWADSLTVGGYAARHGLPLLISTTDRLHPAVAAWFEHHGIRSTVIIGGEQALSKPIADAVPNAQRVGGKTRAETAGAVAEQLWRAADTGARRFVILNGYGNASPIQDYIFGLPAAGYVGDHRAPMLLVHDTGVPQVTARFIANPRCQPETDLVISGMEMQVSADLEAELAGLNGVC